MAKWVGSPTTGHWVDDNGSPIVSPSATGASPPPGGAPATGGYPSGAYPGGTSGSSSSRYGGLGGQNFDDPNRGQATGGAPGQPSHSWDYNALNELNEFGDQMSAGYNYMRDRAGGEYNDYTDYAKGVGARNPTQSQDYYNSIKGSTGPSRESDLFAGQNGNPGPSQSRDAQRDMKSYYETGPQNLRDAYGGQLGYFDSPTNTDSYSDQMKDYGSHAGDTANRYKQRTATDTPDYIANRYRSRQNETGPGSAKDLLGSLQSEKSAADGLMMDPEHTQAIGDLYNNVLMPQESGPGYSEQWYMDTANGDNPYYDRLADKTAQASERRAAASGTFNAGRSQRMQDESLADLRAQQFKDQGALASAADQAKEGRLGTLTTGAKTFEDTVLGNRKYNLDVAGQMDTSRLGLDKIKGDLASSADSTDLRHGEDIDALATGSSNEYNRQQEALDKLASDSDSAEANRRKTTTDYLRSQDDAAGAKHRDQITASGALDTENRLRQGQLADQANKASGEEQGHADYLKELASGADATEASNRTFMSDVAKRASDEGGAGLDREGAAKLADAAARAGIDLNYDAMQAGSLTTAQLGKIQIELAKAGMDEAESQALISGFLGFLGNITGGVLGKKG